MRLRQLVAELDLRGQLELGEFFLEEVNQLGRARLFPILQLDERLGRLAAVRVGNADDGDLGHGRMLVERILDPPRIDLETRGVDHVLDAIDDEDVALRVHVADIAGAEEAAHEAVLGVLRLVPVASHHLRSGDADLPGFALIERGVRIIERAYGNLGGGQRKANRSFARGLRRIARDDGRGLAQAVALDQRRAGDRLEASLHFERQRGAARDAIFERAQVEIGDMRMPQYGVEQRRYARHHDRTKLADQLQGRDQVELRQEDDLESVTDAEIHHRRHGEDVEQWQHAEDAVTVLGD